MKLRQRTDRVSASGRSGRDGNAVVVDVCWRPDGASPVRRHVVGGGHGGRRKRRHTEGETGVGWRSNRRMKGRRGVEMMMMMRGGRKDGRNGRLSTGRGRESGGSERRNGADGVVDAASASAAAVNDVHVELEGGSVGKAEVAVGASQKSGRSHHRVPRRNERRKRRRPRRRRCVERR